MDKRPKMKRINMQKSKVTQFAADNYFAPSHLYNMANFPRQQNKFSYAMGVRVKLLQRKLLPISVWLFSRYFSVSLSSSLCACFSKYSNCVCVSMLSAHNGMVALFFIIPTQLGVGCVSLCVAVIFDFLQRSVRSYLI